MQTYLDTLVDLEKHLLPSDTNFTWFDEKTSNELRIILDDLRKLFENKNELDESHQKKLQELYILLTKIYQDYRSHIAPKDMTAEQLDMYLEEVVKWFKERYRFVDSHPLIKRLWRKLGKTVLLGKKLDTLGSIKELHGPCMLVCTHDTVKEAELLQSLTENHIYWVADLYLGTADFLRIHNWPVLRNIFNAAGLLEVDRKNPTRNVRKLLSNSLHLFEKGKIVGIFPLGSTQKDMNTWNMFKHSAAISLVQYAEKQLKIRIPIIPIGIREEKDRFVINFGEEMYIGAESKDKEKLAEAIIQKIYYLQKQDVAKTVLPNLSFQ